MPKRLSTVAFSTEIRKIDNLFVSAVRNFSQVMNCCCLQPAGRVLDCSNTGSSVNNHSCHRFNYLFLKTVTQFSLAVWFHSFLVLPVGFKAHTEVRCRIPTWQQGALYIPPWGTSDIHPLCRLHTTQSRTRAGGGWVELGGAGWILLITLKWVLSWKV